MSWAARVQEGNTGLRAGELGETQRCGCVPRHLESSPCTWPSESPTRPPCPWWISSSKMGENLPTCPATSSYSPLFLSLLRSPSPFPLLAPDFDPFALSVPLTSSLTPTPRGHLDAKASDGNSAVHCAALHNQPDCLKLLLKGRASVGTGGAPAPPPPHFWFPAPLSVVLPAFFPDGEH